MTVPLRFIAALVAFGLSLTAAMIAENAMTAMVAAQLEVGE